jgi:mannosyl-oligosaccharide alpha-1,2-mannosidase
LIINIPKQDNEIPYGFLNFTTNAPQIATVRTFFLLFRRSDQITQTNIAEAGSLTLEWSTLSKYTNNATYENLATTSAKHIANLVRTTFAGNLEASY